jgi:hypothetical protein
MMTAASLLRPDRLTPWLLAAALVSGCAENEPAAPPAEVVPPITEPAPLTENATLETAEETFTPPYPNRTELFIPPDGGRREVRGHGSCRHHASHGQSPKRRRPLDRAAFESLR